jgi:hypothetical protein
MHCCFPVIATLDANPVGFNAASYSRVMAGTPSGPLPQGPPAEDRGAGQDRGDGPDERYGPLEVDRRRKDDGRSLILYSRIAREESGES